MSQRAANLKFLRRVGACAGITMAIGLGGCAAGFRWNETESLPRGLWRITGAPGHAIRGRIAFFCPPATPEVREAKARGYMREGDCNGVEPLFKPIVAVAGDVVELDASGIRVNGIAVANSAPLDVDGAGRDMPRVGHGAYQVAEGQAWAVSSHTPLSFDSRYIGPIDVSSIQGHAHPIWLLEDSE